MIPKFRAWDKIKRKWRRDVVLRDTGTQHVLRSPKGLNDAIEAFYRSKGNLMPEGEYSEYDNTDWYGVENVEIQLSTTQLDKNKKEIFAGDIVSWTRKKWVNLGKDNEEWKEVIDIGVVEWRDRGFWINKEDFGYEGEDMWNWDQIEVVGNLFENPELVK